MGKIANGITGGVSGKLGNLVGASWKGIDYLRMMPASVTDPQTPGQVSQRQKMAVATAFCKALAQFLRVGFKSAAVRMSGYNAAIGYNIRYAITGVYPSLVIDYTAAAVSRGALPQAIDVVASAGAAGIVNFAWSDNSSEIGAAATDKTLIACFCPALNQATTFSELAQRDDELQSVTVPDSWTGQTIHCYMSFIKADGTIVSNSEYAGQVVVA